MVLFLFLSEFFLKYLDVFCGSGGNLNQRAFINTAMIYQTQPCYHELFVIKFNNWRNSSRCGLVLWILWLFVDALVKILWNCLDFCHHFPQKDCFAIRKKLKNWREKRTVTRAVNRMWESFFDCRFFELSGCFFFESDCLSHNYFFANFQPCKSWNCCSNFSSHSFWDLETFDTKAIKAAHKKPLLSTFCKENFLPVTKSVQLKTKVSQKELTVDELITNILSFQNSKSPKNISVLFSNFLISHEQESELFSSTYLKKKCREFGILQKWL